MISHNVLFWLKSDKVEEGRGVIIQRAVNDLSKIEGVSHLIAGPPLPTGREVVDTSYDVGVSMQFKTTMELDNYHHDPIHQKFVKDCIEPYVDKVVVFDFSQSYK